ncbi:MAG: exonuclease domain-containing protein, partial [Dehalococcoidia bacterium]|nr:exonuclease domain-containing protein [Dehalococcoidia bacterium]
MTQTYVALDLEFTGLDPTRDEIIEIGAVLFDRRRELERFQTLVRPSIPLPLQTERLTGIRRADLTRAPAFDEVKDQLRAFIGQAPIVGQSIAKDVDALAKQGLRLTNPQFDTFELASILLPDLPSYTLASIAAALGVEAPVAHRALADALVARNVFLALLDEGAKLPLATLSQIVSLASVTSWDLRLVFQTLEQEQTRARPIGTLGAALAASGQLDGVAADFFVRASEKLPPLEPNPTLSAGPIAQLLEPGGVAQAVLTEYEHRPEQIAMATAVEEAFRDGEHLIVEAGTGTGKSMAYLLPALEFARRVGEPVVLSTNTLTLQDQIVKKDLPQAL